jgi:hypothetical protein
MGSPLENLSSRETRMGKKCSSQAFVWISAGKFFRRRDSDGEFPVTVPNWSRITRAIHTKAQ